jgi:hypothetical protein
MGFTINPADMDKAATGLLLSFIAVLLSGAVFVKELYKMRAERKVLKPLIKARLTGFKDGHRCYEIAVVNDGTREFSVHSVKISMADLEPSTFGIAAPVELLGQGETAYFDGHGQSKRWTYIREQDDWTTPDEVLVELHDGTMCRKTVEVGNLEYLLPSLLYPQIAVALRNKIPHLMVYLSGRVIFVRNPLARWSSSLLSLDFNRLPLMESCLDAQTQVSTSFKEGTFGYDVAEILEDALLGTFDVEIRPNGELALTWASDLHRAVQATGLPFYTMVFNDSRRAEFIERHRNSNDPLEFEPVLRSTVKVIQFNGNGEQRTA